MAVSGEKYTATKWEMMRIITPVLILLSLFFINQTYEQIVKTGNELHDLQLLIRDMHKDIEFLRTTNDKQDRAIDDLRRIRSEMKGKDLPILN